METYTNNEGTVNEEESVKPTEPDAANEANPEVVNKQNHHTSALYAASMWHSTVKHVKPPHSGGGLLPTQA